MCSLTDTQWVPWVALLAVLIWFCPLDPLYRPQLGYGGAPDYMALFTADAPWRAAAARTGVFKIYPQWAEQATDGQLRTQLADLKRRHIALAIEYAVLTASPQCGAGVESFGGDHLAAVARRIKDLGGTLDYLAMDEPFFWSTLYSGPDACHWAPTVMAANAAVNLHALRAIFPKVRIGDVEPGGLQQRALHRALRGVHPRLRKNDGLRAGILPPLHRGVEFLRRFPPTFSLFTGCSSANAFRSASS